ncbi:MAG: hypothetical protein KGL68_13270 [Burkholderiales bacterium]|nr:hypothetical protein [Burkholderiales bacterium]
MKAHTDDSGRRRDGWRPWLRVAAAAAVLLALSEVLWLWQTWPVRELVQPPPAAGAGEP